MIALYISDCDVLLCTTVLVPTYDCDFMKGSYRHHEAKRESKKKASNKEMDKERFVGLADTLKK